MSLFFCGIVLSHYNSHNLSPVSQVTVHNIFKSLACLAEFFVFLYIGMGCVTGKFKNWNMIFFILCIIFCLIGRIMNIYPLSFVANLFRRQTIPLNMQHVMCFAGLRGAIAFALSMGMPAENRDLYVSTTLSIVVFTTFVCGGMTEPVLKKMDMREGHESSGLHSNNNSSNSSSNNNTSNRSSRDLDGGAEFSPVATEEGASTSSQADFRLDLDPDTEAILNMSNMASKVHAIIEDNEALASLIASSKHVFSAVSDGIREGREGIEAETSSIFSKFDREYMAPMFGESSVSSASCGNSGSRGLHAGSDAGLAADEDYSMDRDASSHRHSNNSSNSSSSRSSSGNSPLKKRTHQNS
jgi:hypothetical protein